MAQYESYKSEIESLGSLVFVAAEKHGGIFKPEKFLEKQPISYPFLLDEDRAVTKSYGVYIAMAVDSINIARPACFVLNGEGVIQYLYLGANQLDRAPMDQVMQAFKSARETVAGR
jgi:peroxiredoxin